MERFRNSVSRLTSRVAYSCVGIGALLAAWQLAISLSGSASMLVAGFSPEATFRALESLWSQGVLFSQAAPSLGRFAIGLTIAAIVGVPVGILTGYFPKADLVTNTAFQFLRVTSPLAWMPVAVIAFGVGDRPVCFLITMAAIWPMVISSAHGVRSVNTQWIRVVKMLGGDNRAVLLRVIVPAVLPEILNGLRIAVGVAWIVLVPAEMLGVSSGLGYYLLDARDRFNYSELMATILLIGMLGFVSDLIIRFAQNIAAWPTRGQEQWRLP